jgi:DHA2 family multidrug resistance protein
MIGYIDDFKFMMWMSIVVVPLLLIIRPAKRGSAGDAAHAVMD